MVPLMSNKWRRYWLDAMNTSSESSPAVLSALGALLILVSFGYMFLRPKRNKGTAPLPPGPIGLPFLGYLPFLGKDLHHSFTRLSSVYGPIFKVALGNKLYIVLSSPSLVKEVLKEQDLIFSNRDPNIAALIATYGGHDIALTNYGPQWRKLRKIFVSEMMSKASIDACSDLRKQETREMLRKLYHHGSNKPVDIGEIALITLVNLFMTMAWGQTVKDVKKRDVDARFRDVVAEQMICFGKPNISDFFPMLARFDIQGIEKRMRKVSSWIESIFDSVIDEYYKNRYDKEDGLGHEKSNTDLLHLIMKKLEDQDDPANSLSLTEVKGLLQDIVIGGTDNTATTIEWAMTELLLHPDDMRKAQEEVRDVVGLNNLVEEYHLSNLKYLAAIIKETLRLHPAAPFPIPHCPSKSTIVGGYNIPKGSQVFINTYAIHRDPQLWEDPLKFRPQRFLDMNKPIDYMGKDLELIPFGSGRRMCPGIPLAQRMALLLLGSMLHAFDWNMPDGEEVDLEESYGIVLKKLKPLVAIPTARLSNLELYG